MKRVRKLQYEFSGARKDSTTRRYLYVLAFLRFYTAKSNIYTVFFLLTL